jgi:hypothetical protein
MGWAVACLAAGCLAWPLRTNHRQAPEIEGVDSQGDALRLSEYRGRVVLLDFWGLG